MAATTDRIERSIVLAAPRGRAWRALADAAEFGAWFGVRLEGEFAPGARLRGRLTIPGFDHLTMELAIERVEPEELLSWRWHPFAIDPAVDYSAEPTTQVELRLADVGAATRLVVVESGFDALPAARRAEAFRRNDGGWAQQLANVARHVATPRPPPPRQ